MKKIIFGIMVASAVASCKKISAGGNEGRLKLEEGTERYSDDEQGTVIQRGTVNASKKTTVKTDSVAVKNIEPVKVENAAPQPAGKTAPTK